MKDIGFFVFVIVAITILSTGYLANNEPWERVKKAGAFTRYTPIDILAFLCFIYGWGNFFIGLTYWLWFK